MKTAEEAADEMTALLVDAVIGDTTVLIHQGETVGELRRRIVVSFLIARDLVIAERVRDAYAKRVDEAIEAIEQTIFETPGVICEVRPLTEIEERGLRRRAELAHRRDGLIVASNLVRNADLAKLLEGAG